MYPPCTPMRPEMSRETYERLVKAISSQDVQLVTGGVVYNAVVLSLRQQNYGHMEFHVAVTGEVAREAPDWPKPETEEHNAQNPEEGLFVSLPETASVR